MEFETDRPSVNLFFEGLGLAAVAFAEEAEIHGECVGGLQHSIHVPGSGSAGGRIGSRGRSSSAADHSGNARGNRGFDLLGADEMNVGINSACGDDRTFSS